MVVKAAAGVLIVGLLGTGSVALAKPGLLGMMPYYTKLSEEHDFGADGGTKYKSKFGSTHKDKLVGVYGKESGKEGNKEWWEWSFKRLQADQIRDGKFAVEGGDSVKKVGSAYSATAQDGSTSPKALNRVCEDAYKSETNNVKEKPNSSETNAFDEAHVWKYCSWLGSKPVTQQQ